MERHAAIQTGAPDPHAADVYDGWLERQRNCDHKDDRNPAPRARLSFPFFFDPGFFTRVQPIDLPDVDVPPDNQGERWGHASVHDFEGTYGEYLLNKVSKVFPELRQASFQDQPAAVAIRSTVFAFPIRQSARSARRRVARLPHWLPFRAGPFGGSTCCKIARLLRKRTFVSWRSHGGRRHLTSRFVIHPVALSEQALRD